MITFNDNFLPAASINSPYSAAITVSGAFGATSFALIAGSFPDGLAMDGTGLITGQATTLGVYSFTIEVSDSSTPQVQTAVHDYQFTVLDLITLQDTTVDQDQFVQQFQNVLSETNTWSSGLTTQTSQTMIEYISAVGTFSEAKLVRGIEDAYPETAQSDSAIRAIANMQGLRLSRKLPSTVYATFTSVINQVIPPFTQFSGSGYNWFNADQISLTANIPLTVTLREGQVFTYTVSGTGKDLQAWVSVDDAFTVSDQDVVVALNNADLYKAFGGLWNYKGTAAFADSTLSDGRLQILFGSQGYGAVPGVNDVVTVTYARTQGDAINGANVAGSSITSPDVQGLTAAFTSNPSGGAAEKDPVAYKNFAAGTFGAYSSGVTKAQYSALVNNYPGVIDAFTQAQREINPAALEWMNIVRVSALTNSPWSQAQAQEFVDYMESVTMYSTKFLWQAPVPIDTDVDVSIYCFNSVNSLSDVGAKVQSAITKLFSPRPGLLMTDFYISDIVETAMNAAPGQISYVVVNKPTQSMIVTAPLSPNLVYNVEQAPNGTLNPLVYSYAVSVDAPSLNQYFQALIDASTNPGFPDATQKGQYWVVSFAGQVGGVAVNVGDQLLATSVGSSAANFQINPMATNDVIDVGVPTNWVYPQVVINDCQVILDWSSNPVRNALQYHVWGRRAGHLGILATLPYSQLSYVDVGGPDPTSMQIGVASNTLIRYNQLGSLNVQAFYAGRQSNVLFPVRDVLG